MNANIWAARRQDMITGRTKRINRRVDVHRLLYLAAINRMPSIGPRTGFPSQCPNAWASGLYELPCRPRCSHTPHANRGMFANVLQ